MPTVTRYRNGAQQTRVIGDDMLYVYLGQGWTLIDANSTPPIGPVTTNPGSGTPGRGVASVTVNASQHLIVAYTDGTTSDAGVAPAGRGVQSSSLVGGHLIVNYTDGTSVDLGNVVGPAQTIFQDTYVLSQPGALVAGRGAGHCPLPAGTSTLVSVGLTIDQAPTGAALVLQLLLDDATAGLFADASRPQIGAGAKVATIPGSQAKTTSLTGGGTGLSVNVVQVGSTYAGSDLTVTIRTSRTS